MAASWTSLETFPLTCLPLGLQWQEVWIQLSLIWRTYMKLIQHGSSGLQEQVGHYHPVLETTQHAFCHTVLVEVVTGFQLQGKWTQGGVSQNLRPWFKTTMPSGLCFCSIIAASNTSHAFFPLILLKQAALYSGSTLFLVCLSLSVHFSYFALAVWLQGWGYSLSVL